MAKKKTTVSVNMKGIEGRGTRIKPGEYLGEVEEVTLEKGDKAQYLAKLSFLRANYLNKVTQARLDLDQALAAGRQARRRRRRWRRTRT